MISLDDITLVAATTKNLLLTCRALVLTGKDIKFGETILFSPHDVSLSLRHEKIEPFTDKRSASQFSMKRLVGYIKTPFVLSVEWDGWLLNPDCWSDEFLGYDYIGAKWPWHNDGYNVGNGGFCLRSKKLLEILSTLDLPDGGADDDFTCRVMRPVLEAQGIRFAPEAIADRFSFERGIPIQPTLGFHGLFNFWRTVSDEDMLGIIPKLEDYVIQSTEYLQLMQSYRTQGKDGIVQSMYGRRYHANGI